MLMAIAASGCRERAAELLHLRGPSGPALPPPVSDPRAIHFTFTGPDAVTFDWSGGGSTIRLWAKDAPPRIIEGHAPSPLPSASTEPVYEAMIGGLVPGKEYAYQVGNPARPVPLSFRAPPPRGADRFTFVALGDVGAASEWPAVVSLHRSIRIADPAFVLVLGDLSYATPKNPATMDQHFEDVMVWSRRIAYMPIWGNHEWEAGATFFANYKARFALPHAGAARGAPGDSGTGEDWYWFDYGNIRFIVYPEPYTADTWSEWAKQAESLFASAEADPALRFVVTAGHRTAYSSGRHGGNEQLRGILDGFGRRFPKYVLNLAGHSHSYERTKPQAHVVHLTAGIGGGALEHSATPCSWPSCTTPTFTARRLLHHGFLELRVYGDVIRAETICGPATPTQDDLHCAEGEIIDSVDIPAAGEVKAASPRRHGAAQAASD